MEKQSRPLGRDLLRELVVVRQVQMQGRNPPMLLEGKRVLVTGGTGSMGKVFVRRVLSGELGMPKKLIVFSRDEAKQHALRQEYQRKRVTTDEVIYRNFAHTLEFR